MDLDQIYKLLQRPAVLRQHIIQRLAAGSRHQDLFDLKGADWQTVSAVLFLLGRDPDNDSSGREPCLILTKRSVKVRQPGDLCCPGGTLSPRLDGVLAALLQLPLSPLTRWPCWQSWRRKYPLQARWLRLLLATGLRESMEEMRLNPFGLRFLGPMSPQPLVMFNRVIYPMAIWVSGQKRFYPNWEVDKIMHLPLRGFFNPAAYARYRLQMETSAGVDQVNTFPCFQYAKDRGTEVLWGATYRITTAFLKQIFDFEPPDMHALPEIHGRLSRSYLTSTPHHTN